MVSYSSHRLAMRKIETKIASYKNPDFTYKILLYITFGDIRQKYSIYPTF